MKKIIFQKLTIEEEKEIKGGNVGSINTESTLETGN